LLSRPCAWLHLVTPGSKQPHSHFFCAKTDARGGTQSMAVPRQRPSVRPAGLLVDGVPFETAETVKRPSSCLAGSTTASSSSPVRMSSARQTALGQNEQTPGVEASSVHCRDGKYVAVKPVEPLSSVLLIPSSDRLPRPSIDCGEAPSLRNEHTPGFGALDKQPPSFDHDV